MAGLDALVEKLVEAIDAYQPSLVLTVERVEEFLPSLTCNLTSSHAVSPLSLQMRRKPVSGEVCHRLQRAGLVKQMRRTRHDLEARLRLHSRHRLTVAARPRRDLPRRRSTASAPARRASASPARSGRPPRETTAPNALGARGRRDERRRGTGARAEQPQRSARSPAHLVDRRQSRVAREMRCRSEGGR